jgi:hypothetical protein
LDLLKELYEETKKLNLNDQNIKSINFVLSIGKKDINVEEDFDKISKEIGEKDDKLSKSLKNPKRYFSNVNVKCLKNSHFSAISELEGPYKIKDSNKINIVIIGQKEVGKSSFCIRFVENKFEDFYIPSIGIEKFAKMTAYNGRNFRINFVVICGSDKLKKWINLIEEADFFFFFMILRKSKALIT